MIGSDAPFVSVIIPVFNDEARLRACLAMLDRQTYPHECFEVLVVDNGSTNPLDEVLLGMPSVRVLREPTPGSYAARNCGIEHSRGEVFAFTDSDCLPQERWLEDGVRMLKTLPNGGGLVGGRVQLFSRDPDRPRAVELYEKALAFRQRENIEENRFAVTANMFTTRHVLDRVGPFDKSLPSGGDREWGQRVHRAGFPQLYAPEAVVLHPARSSFKEIRRKMSRIARGHQQLASRRSLLLRIAEWPRIVAPPVASLAQIAASGELSGALERVRAGGAAVAVKYIWAWSRLQLALSREGPEREGNDV